MSYCQIENFGGYLQKGLRRPNQRELSKVKSQF